MIIDLTEDTRGKWKNRCYICKKKNNIIDMEKCLIIENLTNKEKVRIFVCKTCIKQIDEKQI